MRTDRGKLSWLCGFGVALSLLAGCPGKLQDKARFLVDAGDLDAADAPGEAGAGPELGPCGDVPTRLFVPSCGGTGCHGATAAQQDLDLVSADVASRVVGVQAKVCVGTLADPSNPESSLLYTKLLTGPACGAQMPLARPPLSSTDAACVLSWIAAQ
jgi:hypothetical protein